MSSIKRKLINQLEDQLWSTACEVNCANSWVQWFGTRSNNYVIMVLICRYEVDQGLTVEDCLAKRLESLSLDELIDVVNEC